MQPPRGGLLAAAGVGCLQQPWPSCAAVGGGRDAQVLLRSGLLLGLLWLGRRAALERLVGGQGPAPEDLQVRLRGVARLRGPGVAHLVYRLSCTVGFRLFSTVSTVQHGTTQVQHNGTRQLIVM